MLAGCGYQLSAPVSLQGIDVSISAGVDSDVLRLLEPAPRGERRGGGKGSRPLSLILHEEIYYKVSNCGSSL